MPNNAEELLQLLKDKKLTLGSVESMTGGLFASEFTSVPGSSAVYKGSLITYAASEKIKLAKVCEDTIDQYSVVSKEVAIEMAEGGKKALDVDVCVSVTGNAGPTSDIGGKPVGEVHIAVCLKDKIIHQKFSLKGNRNHIRSMCVKKMINLVLFSLKDEA